MASERIYVLLAAGWRRRWSIVAPVLILPVLGSVVGILTPKAYQAHTSMLIQETARMNPILGDLAIDSAIKERMSSLETLLHSRHILTAVATDIDLIGPETSKSAADQTIDRLSNQISVKMEGRDLLRFEVKGPSPDRMEPLLKSVSARFLEELLAPERSSLADASYFLSEHVKAKREALDSAELALNEYRRENSDALPETFAANSQNLTRLEERLAQQRLSLKAARARFGDLSQQVNRTDPVLAELESTIVAVLGRLSILTSRYTQEHSEVKALRRQLQRLESERSSVMATPGKSAENTDLWRLALGDEVGTKRPLLVLQMDRLQTMKGEIAGLEDEVSMLEGLIGELKEKIQSSNVHAHQLAQLERDLEVKRDLYLELLKRFEMTRITGSLGTFEQDKRVKIIDQPFTPTQPSNFPWWIFTIAGVFGGLGLGMGVALILELLDGKVRTRKMIEEVTGVPLIDRSIWRFDSL